MAVQETSIPDDYYTYQTIKIEGLSLRTPLEGTEGAPHIIGKNFLPRNP